MNRCGNTILANKIGYAPITDNTEISLAVATEMEDCVLVNTKNFDSYCGNAAGTTAIYNAFNVPEDLLQCLPRGCRNTGTLTVTGTPGGEVGATFLHRFDATEYVTGVLMAYFSFPAAGEFEVSLTIGDITQDLDLPGANFYNYAKTVTVDGPKTLPIIFMLDELPTEIGGLGWEATSAGAAIELSIRPLDPATVGILEISTISMFTSIEAFQLNDVIKIGCVEDFSGDVTLDVTDSMCFGSGYDTSTVSIERTFTGSSVTPNYWKLNPLESAGQLETGWVTQRQMMTVEVETRPEGDFGFIQLPDINLNECSFVFIQRAANCNVADSILNRVNTPQAVAIAEDQFILLDPAMTTISDSGKILLNEALIGEELIVSYPQEVEVNHFVANTSMANARRVRLSFERETTDGTRENIIFDNVLVTSFPQSITREETTFAFTVSIQRQANGNFYDRFVVI